MFYEQFKKLCNSVGSTPTAITKQLGYSTSKVTAWKNGSIPKYETLQHISKYFDVPISYLFETKNNNDTPLTNQVCKDTISLGEKIKNFRGNQSIEEFSSKIGLSKKTLIRYENNEIFPTTDVINRICKICNVSIDEIFDNARSLEKVENSDNIEEFEDIKNEPGSILTENEKDILELLNKLPDERLKTKFIGRIEGILEDMLRKSNEN